MVKKKNNLGQRIWVMPYDTKRQLNWPTTPKLYGGPNYTGPRISANDFRNAGRILAFSGQKKGRLIRSMTT